MNHSNHLCLLGLLSLCATTLIAQKIHLQDLEQSIAQISQKNTQKETQYKRFNLHSKPPSFTSSNASFLEHSSRSTERFQKVSDELDRFIQEQGSSPNTWKILPDLLTIIQDLDASEILQLAESLFSKDPDAELNAVFSIYLFSIAAEEDPFLILNPDKELDYDLTTIGFSSLVQKNPTTAREWLDSHLEGLSTGSKNDYGEQQDRLIEIYLNQLLKQDWRAALQAAEGYKAKLNPLALSETTLQNLKTAHNNSANDIEKQKLAHILMQSALARSIDHAKEEALDLNLSHQQLLDLNPSGYSEDKQFIQKKYLDWLVESATEVGDLNSISNHVSNIIQEWTSDDYEASAEWLSLQSPSPARDAGIAGYANALTRIDIETALLWAVQIQDEEKKKVTTAGILHTWQKENPEAAQAWEEANPSQFYKVITP